MKISCDDGCESDKRLAELGQKYDIEVIFYWPVEWHALAAREGFRPLSYQDALEISRQFKVGAHTITHRLLTRIPEAEAKYEIKASKEMLSSLFKVDITDFAPPRGYTNPLLTEFTKRFYEKQRLTKEAGLVHVHPKSGVNDDEYWLERAKRLETKELFCHSQELDRFDLWQELEDYLEDLHS